MGELELQEHQQNSEEEAQLLLHNHNSPGRNGTLHVHQRHQLFTISCWPCTYSFKLASHFLITLLLFVYLAANINYLAFKLKLYVKELPAVLASPWLLLVLACECLYLFSGLIAAVDYLVPPTNKTLPVDTQHALSMRDTVDYHDDEQQLYMSECYPSVDVFIPCCKEPTDVPQESILAALALHYPKDRFKVLVLDDGGDDDLKAFCEALQMETGSQQLIYLRRKKIPGVPHNFKCGNMNYGLEHSDAEFVVMMDADMILHPSFLNRLLPHIINSPNVAFVQIPQSFYNLPIGDPLNDACGFGYDRVMVHRNTLGCASCVGTGAIFRRTHLDEIGGFQPQSITEDTMTAYTLFSRGYKSVYINEKLQVGLTPWTFEGFVKQRQRWGQGAIQQFAATWKSMLGKKSKLNILQKFCYFWHTGYYYMSIINIILVLTLWSALAFHLNLTVGDDEDNQILLSNLAVFMVAWRVFWYALWWEVPQAIQSRNRDESQFWWMTPFFFKMVVEAALDYRNTFKFVPTSNIDRNVAAGKAKQLPLVKKLNDLKHVRAHIVVIILGLCTVGVRTYIAITRYGVKDCSDTFLVLGLSVFVISVCAHMFVPVMHILWPTGFKPEQRKSLLRYNPQGVPQFDPSECAPRWHCSIVFYELISYLTLAFWAAVFWSVHSGFYGRWCDAPLSH